MNCTECQEAIYEYLDQTLEKRLGAQVNSHIASCPACSEFLAGERRAQANIPARLQPAMSARHLDTASKTRLAAGAAAAAALRTKHNTVTLNTWLRPLLAAAAVLLLLAGICAIDRVPGRAGSPATNLLAKAAGIEAATNEFSRFILFACFSNKQELIALNNVQKVIW